MKDDLIKLRDILRKASDKHVRLYEDTQKTDHTIVALTLSEVAYAIQKVINGDSDLRNLNLETHHDPENEEDNLSQNP